MTSLGDLSSDVRFFTSREGETLLGRIKRDLQLSEKLQVARLAMGLSLAQPNRPEPAADRDGGEIRGTTLFKRDNGPVFAALAVQRAAAPLGADEMASELEAHWERGMRLLVARLEEARAAGEDADSVLLALVRETALETSPPEGSAIGVDVIDEQIVGQQAAKRIVIPLVRDALQADPRQLQATLLFTGPASTGKTLFSQTIAEVLDLPFVDANGTVIRRIEELLDRMATAAAEADLVKTQTGSRGGIPVYRYPPTVVFIDECHVLPRTVQTELLTATEPSQREAKTNREIADVSQITFLLATTDPNRLLEPLRTRAREIDLDPYTRGEVAEIVRRRYPRWPSTVHQHLAVAGRLIPRQALTRGDDFDRFMRQDHPTYRPSEALVLAFMREMDMDRLGLIQRDYRYLALLPADGTPVGLQQIASQLRLEEDEVESSVEPFLLQLGFVERSGRGRVLTAAGRNMRDADAAGT